VWQRLGTNNAGMLHLQQWPRNSEGGRVSLPHHITHHAIQRYQECIANLTEAQIIPILSAPVIMRAIELKECRVVLPSGHRVVIAQGRIVTVAPPPLKRRCRTFKPRIKEL